MITDGEPVPGVQRIAVLRANALGDYIVTLPALYALRAAYRQAEITLVGAAWQVRFLPGRPGPVDRVELLPAGAAETGDGAEAFCASMRERSFDLALQLHGGGRYTNPLVQGFGARVSAGLRAPDAIPLDRWVRYEYYQPEVFRMLEVVGLVGAAPTMTSPLLELIGADHREADRVLAEQRLGGRFAALHPGATDARRRWPPERFGEVARALLDAGLEVLVTGGTGEDELVRTVLRCAPGASGLTGQLSIGGLGALYSRCAVVVSNDTGPLHLAMAVGAPTVGIYWCGNLINAGPLTRARHRPQLSWTVACPECGADCTRDLYPARTGGTACRHRPSFVADVPVAEVTAAAFDLLSACDRGAVQGTATSA